ncbi:TA system VapC family ribonuclease toxin [Deinococcus aestuarii]|uniref:TA system VapC family ribonuclease toxin n=1 Tax=Deinococcus aestuarii TaxID=2774531 RepID=UPI001C0D1DB3
MSDLLDANLLLNAFRRDTPAHLASYGWLTRTLQEGEAVWTTSVNELALLRIVTLAALGSLAAPPERVFEFLAALHAQPNSRYLELGKAGLGRWRHLTLDLGLRGNGLNDAYLVALALEHRLTLVTADQGSRAFRGCGCSPLPEGASLNPGTPQTPAAPRPPATPRSRRGRRRARPRASPRPAR